MLDYEFLQLLIILFINCFTDRVVADSYSQTWRNTYIKARSIRVIQNVF